MSRPTAPAPDAEAREPSSRRTIIKRVVLLVVAVVSLVFSVLFIWYSRNTGHDFWVYWAPFFLAGGALLLGVPVYKAQHSHMAEPEPVPEYR